MQPRIIQTLQAISKDHDVRILYACESGSRAWGFASQNSDWDVRFLYLRKLDWYLCIDLDRRPDVIELPIVDDLDISGWDLRKALRLFQKSNPPLLEWLTSPIVYTEEAEVVSRLRSLVPESYSPTACMYHYYKMAKNNFREYLRGDTVRLKKYLYVLRPVLAVIHLEQNLGPVPVQFSTLVDRVVTDTALYDAINDLVDQKTTGQELDQGPRIPALSDFLEFQLNRMAEQGFEKRVQRCPVEKLNALFVDAVNGTLQAFSKEEKRYAKNCCGPLSAK